MLCKPNFMTNKEANEMIMFLIGHPFSHPPVELTLFCGFWICHFAPLIDANRITEAVT